MWAKVLQMPRKTTFQIILSFYVVKYLEREVLSFVLLQVLGEGARTLFMITSVCEEACNYYAVS